MFEKLITVANTEHSKRLSLYLWITTDSPNTYLKDFENSQKTSA